MNRRPYPMLSLMLFLAVMGNQTRGDQAGSASEKRTPGLIGLAHKNGEPTQIAYHYPHGKVFPADLIRSRFHDGETELPSVEIALVGYVEVPHKMDVHVYHAAGGVNGDHGTLFLDDHQIGQVGDDMAKNVVYTLTLPQGTHEIRWVLTGGLFQTNLLKFQTATTGDLLSVYHTAKQRDETGAAKAAKTIDAQGTVEGWPPVDPKNWLRVSLQPKKAYAAEIRALQQERIAVLAEAAEYILQQYKEGRIVFGAVVLAQADLVKARLDATDQPEERLSLLEKQLQLAETALECAQQKFEAGATTKADVWQAKAHALDVRIQLLRERAGPTAPTK